MFSIALLLTLFIATTFNQSNQNTQVLAYSQTDNWNTFQLIETYYNTKNFSLLYSMLSITAQLDTNLTTFTHTYQQLYKFSGLIEQSTYSGYRNGIVNFIISFKKHMQISSLSWTYDGALLGNLVISQPQTKSMLSFFHGQPKNSITVYQNESKVIAFNENEKRPICNQLRISVVIEYARQVSMNIIYPNTTVNVAQVKKFYIKKNDQLFDTFIYWATSQSLYNNNLLSLDTIVYGMVVYNINANAEYLETYLGLNNIRKTLQKMDIKQTKAVYHVSSQLMFTNFQRLKQKDYLKFITSMTSKQFMTTQLQVHTLLLQNKSQALFIRAYSDLKKPYVMAIAANWLILSSTNQQAKLMTMINKGQFNQGSTIDLQMADLIHQIMGYGQSISQQLLFQRSGINTGSINSPNYKNAVMSSEGYSVLKTADEIQTFSYALVVQGLTNKQYGQIYLQMDHFLTMILSNGDFNLEFNRRLNYVY